MELLRTPQAWPRVLFPPGLDVDTDPSLASAERAGAWRAFRHAVLELGPEAVIRVVSASGLRGRGGAGFPTGEKWRICREADAERRFAIANGYEADPGALLDRTLMERNPHAVVEGLALAAFAVGAREAYLVVKVDYGTAIRRLRTAIREAEEAGYLGTDILGTGLTLVMEVRGLQGSFMLGEETVLLRSLESRRGMPEQRPPYPAVSGLWGDPTVVNNVETLAAVPWIVANGEDGYAELGSQGDPGSTLIQLSGAVRRPGVVEVPVGLPIGQLVNDLAGGVPGAHRIKAVMVGGPSGGFLPVTALETPLAVGPLQAAGAIMGSGQVLVIDERACMVDLARMMTRYLSDEACGKTIPCRIGIRRLYELADGLSTGRHRPSDPQLIRDLAADVMDGGLCAVETTAPNPLLTGMRYFGEEFEDHITRGQCPAGVCRPLRVAPVAVS